MPPHAATQAEARGATLDEVEEVVRAALALHSAKPNRVPGRLESELEFAYDGVWRGAHYRRKLVRVVFVHEGPRALVYVVTVIVQFGR